MAQGSTYMGFDPKTLKGFFVNLGFGGLVGLGCVLMYKDITNTAEKERTYMRAEILRLSNEAREDRNEAKEERREIWRQVQKDHGAIRQAIVDLTAEVRKMAKSPEGDDDP